MSKIKQSSKPKSTGDKFKTKLNAFKAKAKAKLKDLYGMLIHQEVYVDGQEPPKSYSYQKKFFGLYAFFIIYSFILILISDPKLLGFLTFGDPFSFSLAIVAFFLVLSFLFSVDKIRIYIFEKKTVLKQLILYISLIALFYLIFKFLFIQFNINFMTFLLVLAMIWLILLSSRFYIYSRKFSTKIEARFIKRYSVARYYFAIIIPFIILVILVIMSLIYRSFLVFLSLDLFAHSDPTSAVAVYNLEMRIIMPLIYFSLVMTLVFIIFEYVSTRRRAETKRAGTFDNFTFSLIVLFIFFFQIMQITIYLLSQPETITALKLAVGTGGTILAYVFIVEFAVSLYFLYRIIKKTGKTLGWRIFIFKKDGLILLILACVFAQTLTRFSFKNEIPYQGITAVGKWLMADKFIISILIIFFLGTTLLVYYIKPHETSMFMRLQKETVSQEDKSMDIIYKIIRSEYIRRGEAYPLEILERELVKATRLSISNIYSLISQLVKKDMDIIITEQKEEFGKPRKMIDFVSVTERFEKKEVAEQKAKKFLSERLFETALQKEKKESRLLKGVKAGQPKDSFISSLTTDYSKKQKDKEIFQQKLKAGTQISFADLTEDLKNEIIRLIKKEYISRIAKPVKIPDFYLPISEITSQVESKTKISPGELYLILNDLSKTDLELRLIDNPDEPEDKLIKFLPFSDDSMNFSLMNFRPEEYSKFRLLVTKNFLKYVKSKREKRVIFQLKKEIPAQTESQKSWLDLLNILYKDYSIYAKQLIEVPNKQKLLSQIDTMVKEYEKRLILLNSKIPQ
ncbi:hypothetical protein LCGC14_0998340 [marine sediment metagenome]|uniref:Uncharacterized protein n=1 Tax=marine sediment metagenome TaxID=412755 RepID=A0A0F9R9Z3_9ZZZZ